MYDVVFNAGIYDLLHKGHLNLLRNMRYQAYKLIIVVHDDLSCFKIKDKFPVQPLKQRVTNLRLTGLVDDVVVTDCEDPYLAFKKVLKKYPNAHYMRGDDKTGNFPGSWFLEEKNVPITYLPYTKEVSSTQLRDILCGL